MKRYKIEYMWNGYKMIHLDSTYVNISKLVDDLFQHDVESVQIYILNKDYVYEYLLTINNRR